MYNPAGLIEIKYCVQQKTARARQPVISLFTIYHAKHCNFKGSFTTILLFILPVPFVNAYYFSHPNEEP